MNAFGQTVLHPYPRVYFINDFSKKHCTMIFQDYIIERIMGKVYCKVQGKSLNEIWSFPLEISSVNVTKSAEICGLGHFYWRNP